MNWPKPRAAAPTMDAAEYAATAAKAERKKSPRYEESAQIKLIGMCRQLAPKYPDLHFIHHSPNGGKRDQRTAAWMKALGASAGFPDLILIARRDPYVGLAIELKFGKNEPSTAQDNWLMHMHRNGWRCEVLAADNVFDLANTALLVLADYLDIAAPDYAPLLLS